MTPFRSINPWNGEVLQEFLPTDPVATEQALTLAEHCFATWREQSFLENLVFFTDSHSSCATRKSNWHD